MERWRSAPRCASLRTCQKSASVSWPIIWAPITENSGTHILENGFVVLAVQLLGRVWLCDYMDCSTLGFPVLHCLQEFAQNHVRWVSDAIQLCHPLSPPSPSSLLSIFPSIRVFSSELALCINWPEYWGFSFRIPPSNEYSGLISFGIESFDLLAVQGALKSILHTTVWKHQFFGAQPSLWSTSHIHTWL